MKFYDELSTWYDQMISFESRYENEREIFGAVLKKFPAKKIIDAGCGSGYHSIVLSSLGTKVTAFDPSDEMLKLAIDNAKKYKFNIDFINSDFLNFYKNTDQNFDALYTLGNSFVHLINLQDISGALKNFYNILNPGGYAFIGIINYDKILKTGQTEISKKDKNGIIFHRYYTLNKKSVTFNIKISGVENHHFKTELYPLTSEELTELSFDSGFKTVELYGNLKLDKYKQFESENIVAFLRK